MRVTLFDYGAGNLHSLAKAIAREGVEVAIEADPRRATDTDLLVLPGVGAFAPAAAALAPGRAQMRAALENGLPCLGICLGMQLLFEASDEGPGEGLGVFRGRVTRLNARRVPHMGWSPIESVGPAERLPELAYYAHSFVCRAEEPDVVIGWTTHESDRFATAVRRGQVLGVQFHPEKSSTSGVALISRFLEEVRR